MRKLDIEKIKIQAKMELKQGRERRKADFALLEARQAHELAMERVRLHYAQAAQASSQLGFGLPVAGGLPAGGLPVQVGNLAAPGGSLGDNAIGNFSRDEVASAFPRFADNDMNAHEF